MILRLSLLAYIVLCTTAQSIFNFGYTGYIVQWNVSISGHYKITAYGAQGCGSLSSLGFYFAGCLGAMIQGIFTLSQSQVLSILVGQQPCAYYQGVPGGGGATFVALNGTPLIAAGAGGGGADFSCGTAANCGGQVSSVGAGYYSGTAGYGANTAPCGGGAGGFYTGGQPDSLFSSNGQGFGPGQGFMNGGAGASGWHSSSYQYSAGGFGGGATGNREIFSTPSYSYYFCYALAGAGGGYSGGSGYEYNFNHYCGNGGGSYNGGFAQINNATSNSGNGFVRLGSNFSCVIIIIF